MKKLKINRRFTALALAGTLILVGRANMDKKDTIKDINIKDIDIVETVYANTESSIDLITTDYLNIRKESNTNSEILDTVNPGTRLYGISNDGEWYKIKYNDDIAYVKSEYVYESINNDKNLLKEEDLEIKEIKSVEATTNVNIRKDSSIDSEILNTLSEGQKLETTNLLDNGWYEVIYNGEKAYVFKEYVKEVIEEKITNPFNKIVMFNNESNIYSKDNNIIDTVPTNEIAFVYGIKDNKYIATVNNKICYINKEDVIDLERKIVIVDLSEQNAKLYDGNRIIVDTPVVTGKNSTPTDQGYFDIDSKETNRYLKGPGYSSYVDYWMPYNGDEGLHDAEYHTDYDENGNAVISHGWRNYSEFGGSTHEYNGSHGCVNLPNEAAKKIYENVEVGTKVIVKK